MQIESEVKCKYLLSCLRVDLSIFLSALQRFLGATSRLRFINFHFIIPLKSFSFEIIIICSYSFRCTSVVTHNTSAKMFFFKTELRFSAGSMAERNCFYKHCRHKSHNKRSSNVW